MKGYKLMWCPFCGKRRKAVMFEKPICLSGHTKEVHVCYTMRHGCGVNGVVFIT